MDEVVRRAGFFQGRRCGSDGAGRSRGLGAALRRPRHRYRYAGRRDGGNIIISGSQYERRLISQRTRDALAAKRARGERLGAAPALPMQITRRIVTERRQGRTFQAIAEGLMADGIRTARGKTRWYAATIKAVVTSDNAATLA